MDPLEANRPPPAARADPPTDSEDSSDDDFEFSPAPADPNSAVYPVFNRDVPLFHGDEVPPTAINKKSRSTGDTGRRPREAAAAGGRSQSDGKAKMKMVVLGNGGEQSSARKKGRGGEVAARGLHHAKGGGLQRRSYLPYRSIFAGLVGSSKGSDRI